MIFLYRMITTLFYPFIILFIFFRKFINKEHKFRYKEKILFNYFKVVREKDTKLIWFHAASVGEFKSILPIIRKLNEEKNNFEFLITTTTLSSGNIAVNEIKNYENVHHRFFPVDIKFLIERFLEMWQPNVLFLVDSEIWPNLILLCKRKKIPISLINGRITAKTFKRWQYFPKTAKFIFNSFDLCLTSNQETKDFLLQFDVKDVYYNGNIKLYNEIEKEKIETLNEKFFSENEFWIAASTHEGEEKFCLKTHVAIKEKIKNITTVIAPRHITRVNRIEKLCNDLKLDTQILNKGETILGNKDIVIVNSFGSLLEFFKYAKSVFMGKSLIRDLKEVSGQNPIEAAKLGCKVYHGPYVYNFREIYEILKKNNVSLEITDTEQLSKKLLEDFKNMKENEDKSKTYLNELGDEIMKKTIKNINQLLINENIKT